MMPTRQQNMNHFTILFKPEGSANPLRKKMEGVNLLLHAFACDGV